MVAKKSGHVPATVTEKINNGAAAAVVLLRNAKRKEAMSQTAAINAFCGPKF